MMSASFVPRFFQRSGLLSDTSLGFIRPLQLNGVAANLFGVPRADVADLVRRLIMLTVPCVPPPYILPNRSPNPKLCETTKVMVARIKHWARIDVSHAQNTKRPTGEAPIGRRLISAKLRKKRPIIARADAPTVFDLGYNPRSKESG